MGNVGVALKRFLSNKNTVTIIGIILGVVVLYLGYDWRVKQAITPVKVPVAREEIPSRTLITEDMIEFVDLPKNLVNSTDNLLTNINLIVDRYARYGTTIPKNSLFYKEAIMTEEEQPDSAFANIPDDSTIYSLGVDLHRTYGNSIFPGNYIDLYFSGIDDSGQIIFGKFIESIEVLAVKDNQGNHVFSSTVENRIPSELLFAVRNDMYDLLMKAKYISGRAIDIIPVPRNAAYTAEPGDTSVSSEYIRDFILSKSAIIPDNTTE